MMTDLREVIAKAVGCIPMVDDMPLGSVACNELADAALAAIQAAGYVAVPVEPTPGMVEAGEQADDQCLATSPYYAAKDIYRAMIEAAK